MNTPSDQIPPGPPSPGSPASGPAPDVDVHVRQWAMFAHLSALLGGLITAGWAGSVGSIIGPLIIWLVKKDEMPFVDDQGKEALNFNITVTIVSLGLLLFSLITFGIGFFIAVPCWIIIGIYWLVMTIIAAIRANDGEAYRYPICLRLIK